MAGIDLGAALDVGIGLVVMFLMLSLVGTTLNEMFSTFLNLRRRDLEKAIKAVLNDQELQAAFYKSGIVAGIKDSLGRHPSYIASRNFADAVLGSIARGQPLPRFEDFKKLVQDLPQSNIKDVLLAQISHAENDITKLRDGVAQWFDSAMDRVSGAYKRNLKFISLGFGLAIAVSFNADCVKVTSALWEDKALRAQMVLIANSEMKAAADAAASANQENKDNKFAQDLEKSHQVYEKALSVLKPLPIGWTDADRTAIHGAWTKQDWWALLLALLQRMPGWIITGLAVSLGAPFWFDLLSKFMNVRGAGQQPPKANEAKT